MLERNSKGQFIKGIIPWIKGRHHTKKSKEKNKQSHLGHVPWNKGKKGLQVAWNKGKSNFWCKGERNPMKRVGARKKIGLTHKGAKCSFWKGGLTDLVKQIKNSFEWKIWREKVFTRDNWTCQKCREKGGKLCPHHLRALHQILKDNNIKTIKEALNCKELWNIKNGQTLCRKCHKTTENYGKPR